MPSLPIWRKLFVAIKEQALAFFLVSEENAMNLQNKAVIVPFFRLEINLIGLFLTKISY